MASQVRRFKFLRSRKIWRAPCASMIIHEPASLLFDRLWSKISLRCTSKKRFPEVRSALMLLEMSSSNLHTSRCCFNSSSGQNVNIPRWRPVNHEARGFFRKHESFLVTFRPGVEGASRVGPSVSDVDSPTSSRHGEFSHPERD